ncbi:MAG: ribosome-associated translation inhibitor RaiA [Chloroflexi bacterium]|nr:ribosome-associated translation inhibitor RaiA [Chloroflexota bacterium]
MEVLITGKNIEVTPRIRGYVQKKLLTLERHFKSIPVLVLHVVLAREKAKSSEKRFIAEFTTNVRDVVLRSEETADDLRPAIDLAVEALDHQIERFKGRRKSRRRGVSAPEQVALASEELDRQVSSRIARVKQHVIKPMSVDEAIDQMELLGHDFFLFFNRDTEEPNVVYRRKAGYYGLLEARSE